MKALLKSWGAVAALAVAAIMALFVSPTHAQPVLNVCVDWLQGFTAHLDGLALAAVPVASIKAWKEKRSTLLADAGKILEVPEGETVKADDLKRFEDLHAQAEGLRTQIDAAEKQNRLEAEMNQPEGLRTAEGGQVETRTEQKPQAQTPQTPVVGDDRARRARMAQNTLRIFRGLAMRDGAEVRTAQQELAKDGFYGPEAQKRAAGDYYSTAVDADGAILLPTTVYGEVEQVASIYGVARRLCRVFDHATGVLKVPGASGALPVAAVAEGAAIASQMRAFKAVSLNPKKWAVIAPYTLEAQMEMAPQIMADLNTTLGMSFAKAEDDALFNGDGTATYNSVDGVLSANRASVATYTLPAGKTSFADLSADDLFKMRNSIPAGVRAQAAYAFHPDMEAYIRILKDGAGQYIMVFNADTGVATIGCRPVAFTEVLPDIGDSGANKTFGVFGAFGFFKMAVGGGMSAEELREGTVKDADTGADINLATQDLRALKVREFFDMDCNFEEVFTKVATPAA